MVPGLALAAPALIQGGASLINYFRNKNALKKMPKRPGFEGSSYADMLKRRSEEGMYSPETMNTMMRDVGQGVSERTEMGKSGYARRLLNQGIGGSMAGQRGLNEFETSKSEQLTGAERKLTMANEASKLGAGEQYEQLKYGDQIQQYMDKLGRQQSGMENESQLISGLAGAATTGMGAYTTALQDKEASSQLDKLLAGLSGTGGIQGNQLDESYYNFQMPKLDTRNSYRKGLAYKP